MSAWWEALPRDRFGDSAALNDELVALVVAGRKIATCGASRDYPEGPPALGYLSVIEDGAGRPRCVIETTEIAIRRFDDVDADFARDEGEGDLSYAFWRQAHEDYFRRTGGFSPDMNVICERFRLVEIISQDQAQ